MMGAESMGPPDESWDDPGSEGRPYGTRPYGTRPYGTRPYGTRPYGTRPYGTRTDEDDDRPYGTRPYGTRPYGTRPYGTRPYGTRPYGTRRDVPESVIDRDEWADDVAELFCASSAVISLGASVVVTDCEDGIPVPSIEAASGTASYLDTHQGVVDPRGAPPAPGASPEKPVLPTVRRILRPRDHELAVRAVLPDHLARDISERPELAWPLKQDLADDLALSADRAFLRGAGGAAPEPCGIRSTTGVHQSAGAGISAVYAAFRQLLYDVRATGALFRAPGFILSPAAFDTLATLGIPNVAGATLDMGNLLQYDSGLLFGYPYVVTTAAMDVARDEVYFSADWGEAWIAVDRRIATIEVATDARLQTDETVIRAVSHHDFVVRRPAAFRYLVMP